MMKAGCNQLGLHAGREREGGLRNMRGAGVPVHAATQRRQRRWLLPARSGGARRTLPLAYLESLSEFIQ